MLIACVRIVPLPERRKDILEILRHAQSSVYLSTGCITCAIYEECDENSAILYLETWRSQKELHQHIQSPLYRQILIAMEMALELPEVRFHDVANSQGMELVETLRGCERS